MQYVHQCPNAATHHLKSRLPPSSRYDPHRSGGGTRPFPPGCDQRLGKIDHSLGALETGYRQSSVDPAIGSSENFNLGFPG